MMNWLLNQCFPAETHVLAVIRARVREVCQQVGCGDAWEDAVVLAVNEACMNVIQHGYGPAGGGELLLRLGVDDDVFVVQLLKVCYWIEHILFVTGYRLRVTG